MTTLAYYALLATSLTIAATGPAHAYLDPGTGSIILQSVIGAVAAGMVLGRAYLYRIKSWFGMVPAKTDENGQRSAE